MTIRTRIHDMIDVMAEIRNKTGSDVAFTVRATETGFSFTIVTSTGREHFPNIASAEAWLADSILAIGSETDPQAARARQEVAQAKVKLAANIVALQAQLAAM